MFSPVDNQLISRLRGKSSPKTQLSSPTIFYDLFGHVVSSITPLPVTSILSAQLWDNFRCARGGLRNLDIKGAQVNNKKSKSKISQKSKKQFTKTTTALSTPDSLLQSWYSTLVDDEAASALVKTFGVPQFERMNAWVGWMLTSTAAGGNSRYEEMDS